MTISFALFSSLFLLTAGALIGKPNQVKGYVMNTQTSVTRFNELIYTDIGYSYR
jgi:hypothetical protein